MVLLPLLLFTLLSPKGHTQNQHKVTIERQSLITPSKFTLKLNCVSSNFLNNPWMKDQSFISKDSIINILRNTEHLKLEDSTNKSGQEFLEVLFVEVTGINAYQEIKKKLKSKAKIKVEKYHVENFQKHESELINQIINEARLSANEELEKDGRKVGKMLSYKEIIKVRKTPINEEIEGQPKDLGMLKEYFIEENYNGHLVNTKGQIILKKKLEIRFEIE